MTTIADKAPDINGFARAWRMDITKAHEAADAVAKADDATIGGWIVNAPWSHPFWPNVAVVMIHLRDMPNQSKPPTRHLEGATHEIIVLALDPDHYPPEVDGARLRFLTPSNFVGQFKAADDVAAQAALDAVVARICAGTLNPDTDATSQWIDLFGDHCFKADYRRGIMGSVNEGVPL